MGTKTRIVRWGTSLVVRIPKPIAEHWGVQEGSVIEMIWQGDQVVMRKGTYGLNALFGQITLDNVHPEVDSGPAQGNEAW